MPYIAAEPKQKQVFEDNKGKYHNTRDKALEASFENDLFEAIVKCKQGAKSIDDTNIAVLTVKKFLFRYPDLARVYMGDQDFTGAKT